MRNFKMVYREQLSLQKREGNLPPITSLGAQKCGRPPLLFDLGSKLVSFLLNLRSRGGFVNGKVVSAAAKALNK